LQRDIDTLDRQLADLAEKRQFSGMLMTHPGVGPITALATEVYLGNPSRFPDGKALSSYVGMIPAENSSGKQRRLSKLTKQGNAMLRFLWCEAVHHAVRQDMELKRFYTRKLVQKGDWIKPKWQRVASWGFACGSCYAISWTTASSAVADGSSGTPMREAWWVTWSRPTGRDRRSE
jgi:transposase